MTMTISENAVIENWIRKIIGEKLGLDETQLTDDANFHDDLGIDSLDVLEVHLEIEREFHFAIPDEDAEKLVTTGSIITYIKSKNIH
jgi:acyl carrier protein